MDRIKSWLAYKILRAIKNCSVAYMNFLIQDIIAIVKDHFCEKRLGIETGEPDFSKENCSLYRDAAAYHATPYGRLEKMLDYLKLNRDDVFIDLGCGKGRVILFVAGQKLKKVIGIEIRRKLVDIAKGNLNRLRLNNTPVEIIEADAATFDLKEGTVFFMFNPFGCKTLTKVVENIKDSINTNPRKIRIVYFSAAWPDILNSQGWLIPEGQVDNSAIYVWHNRI